MSRSLSSSHFLRRPLFAVALVVAVLGSLAAAVLPGLLADPREALAAAATAGYRDARVVAEHRILAELAGCSRGDSAGFEVEAVNPAGDRVRLLVCVGWPFKAATLRFR